MCISTNISILSSLNNDFVSCVALGINRRFREFCAICKFELAFKFTHMFFYARQVRNAYTTEARYRSVSKNVAENVSCLFVSG